MGDSVSGAAFAILGFGVHVAKRLKRLDSLQNSRSKHVHFTGVGGIGMSGLAEILINLGYAVSGSDLEHSDIVERLETYGLTFYEGHEAKHVDGADIVVISAAVPEDNVEVLAATEHGIPILHRSQLLADLLRMKPHAVVVGGSHGKTTTTSMVSAVLEQANIGATSIIGGILHRSGTNARWGTGDYIVAEADEHDGSFLRLHPTIGVVTNIDAEHMEYYGTLDNLKRAFLEFCNGIPFYGYAVVCLDSDNVRAIVDEITSETMSYGLAEGVSVRAVDVRLGNRDESKAMTSQIDTLTTCFDVVCSDERLGVSGKLGSIELRALGENNVRNALAACTVGLCLGLPFGIIVDGLRHFDGVRRRLQVRGEMNGITVVEDYAHHPTEIASTLEAIRWTDPGRVVVVFQPHLYSRTKFFAEEFAEVLLDVDCAIVTDIYPSREEPMPGVDSGLIVNRARERGGLHVELVSDKDDVVAQLVPQLTPGDVVLILGAGDINQIVEPLLAEIAG
ncbi:MAG: UDP-N-acetylmuramate--L-alanine ligase [Candidatus Hydrogenedentota bacterium]